MNTNLHSTMLLLIPEGGAWIRFNPLEFTFHYASTYTRQRICPGMCRRYLHSTMLLLILLCGVGGRRAWAFTFHYASTYTRLQYRTKSLWIIYIPLCFYLYNAGSVSVQSTAKFTFHYASTYTVVERPAWRQGWYLHSTMLLLIPRCFSLGRGRNIIYIPLCFYLYVRVITNHLHFHNLHSTMLLLIHSCEQINVSGSFIYIPLCFYLYFCACNASFRISWFTFHYASTYTVPFRVLFFAVTLIYIPLCFYLYERRTNERKSKKYLHSTMLLLIRLYQTGYRNLPSFTFHYASTYTFLCPAGFSPLARFTFHYASTYTKRNLFRESIPVLFTFHYASTYTTLRQVRLAQ